jgi:ribose-phosphate pyrophosphokinase
MQFLHLDKKFTPYKASIDFDTFTFSGGEPHIKISTLLLENEKVMITNRIKSFNDLGFVLLAADALKRMRVEHIELLIPYFPAARQDRLMIPGEPLSVKVMADLINSVGFKKVQIVDPHSEVTPALLNNVEVISNHDFVKRALEKLGNNLNDITLVSPDGGAAKKIFKLSKYLGGIEVVEAGKVRDVKTGKLKDFRVFENDLTGKNCIVIDDICDGGGTFLGLAKALRAKGAKKLVLIVTHGIFSKGADELKKYYDHIICSDAFSTLELEGVEQLKIIK